ncbi:hypothetical protein J1605_022325 [Eschrichtius robustus]|uniref:Uncharacterized protein n=1 Tax=Eschrichtius robustus TaxID=9764 RepID=A0AB34HBB0_ESCRO|nr:hypothetical protein J1605_022325 [Eschrichtius robustus]
MRNSDSAAGNGGEVALAAAEAFSAWRTPSFSLPHIGPDFYSEKALILGGSERGHLVQRDSPASILKGGHRQIIQKLTDPITRLPDPITGLPDASGDCFETMQEEEEG